MRAQQAYTTSHDHWPLIGSYTFHRSITGVAAEQSCSAAESIWVSSRMLLI